MAKEKCLSAGQVVGYAVRVRIDCSRSFFAGNALHHVTRTLANLAEGWNCSVMHTRSILRLFDSDGLPQSHQEYFMPDHRDDGAYFYVTTWFESKKEAAAGSSPLVYLRNVIIHWINILCLCSNQGFQRVAKIVWRHLG